MFSYDILTLTFYLFDLLTCFSPLTCFELLSPYVLALFLAYTSGAVGLCCALLRSGAKLGTINKQGVSLFNAPVATKKLLFRLLGTVFLNFKQLCCYKYAMSP